MIGNGGHYRQLIGEGASERLNLVAIGNTRARRKEALAHALTWDVFVSNTALVVSDWNTTLAEGVQVCAFACVMAGATIGKHTIINAGAIVHHDCKVGDFVHVAPGAQVLGGATVGEGSWIGANATVIQGSTVPPWVMVRAGSVFPNDYTRGIHKLRPIPE